MMEKYDIIHSLQVLEQEGEIEVIETRNNSVLIYDYQDGKEIQYTFHQSKTSLGSKIHISRKIPQKYRPNKEKLVQYLLALPTDMLLTLNQIWFVWDVEDYEKMAEYHGVDTAWAESLWDEDCVGKCWFDQNTAIVNMQNIVNTALEIEAEDVSMGIISNTTQDILEQAIITLIHELRHVMMDTNIILPEKEYPIYLASEEEVEKFARLWVEQHGYCVY